jgi:hypothetical protein
MFRKGDIVRYVGPSLGLHGRDWEVVVGERFGWVKVRWGMGCMKLRAVFLERKAA